MLGDELRQFLGDAQFEAFRAFQQSHQPVVFVGPYEHHSNEVTWRQGLATVVEVNLAPDGGVDLVLTKPGKSGGEKFLVQCKQWRAYKVSVNIVRELLGAMAAQGAAGGFVVTSGVFTAEARAFAEGLNIELIDGTALAAMIDQACSADVSRPVMAVPEPPRVLRRPGIVSQVGMACSES